MSCAILSALACAIAIKSFSAIAVTIKYDDEPLRRHLSALQAKLGDLTPAMNSIGMEMESRISRRFETRTDPDGKAWKPWKAATIRSYPRPGTATARRYGRSGHGSLLDRFGDMLAGLSYHADKTSVRIGFDRPYAKWHEVGTSRMPRRGLLASSNGRLSDADASHILALLERYLKEKN